MSPNTHFPDKKQNFNNYLGLVQFKERNIEIVGEESRSGGWK